LAPAPGSCRKQRDSQRAGSWADPCPPQTPHLQPSSQGEDTRTQAGQGQLSRAHGQLWGILDNRLTKDIQFVDNK